MTSPCCERRLTPIHSWELDRCQRHDAERPFRCTGCGRIYLLSELYPVAPDGMPFP